MTTKSCNERAAAEMIGALVLVSLLVVVIGIIAVVWFSQPSPQKLPAIAISITNQSKIIEISHDGGDPVILNELFVLVNGIPHSYACTDCGDSWSIGEILTVDYSDQTNFPNQVDVVYKGTRQQLLTTKYLGTMTVTPTPVTPPATATPTATPTATTTPVLPPVAAFSTNVTSGTVPQVVQFTDTSLFTPTTPAPWAWTFGDGTASSEQNPVHTYTSAGTYTVTLTVQNSAGSSSVQCRP